MVLALALALTHAAPPSHAKGPVDHAGTWQSPAADRNPHIREKLDGIDNDRDGLVDNLRLVHADAVLAAPDGVDLLRVHNIGVLGADEGDSLLITGSDDRAYILREPHHNRGLEGATALQGDPGSRIGHAAARLGDQVLIGEPGSSAVIFFSATDLTIDLTQTGPSGFGSALATWRGTYWAAGAADSSSVAMYDASGTLLRSVQAPHSELIDLGYSVALGDIQADDGLPDLLFGGPSSSDPKPGEYNHTGVTYLWGSYDNCNWTYGGSGCQLIYGEIGYARVGESMLATPDVTGDGREDWISGAPDYYGKGLVAVKPGADAIPDEHNGLASFAYTRLYGEPNSFLGADVASGDINGDGTADVVAGAPGDGTAFILMSDGGVLPGGSVWTPGLASIDSETPMSASLQPFFVPGTITPSTGRWQPEAFEAAYDVAVLDANGDGLADVAVLTRAAAYVFLSRF